jgi:hypothetical protein
MDSRRLSLLSAAAVILLPVAPAKSEAGWLCGREGRFRPLRHHDSCAVPCEPSCLVANPCECLPLLLPAPCAPPAIPLVTETISAAPVALPGVDWDMPPTGHETWFLDTGRGSRVQPPPFPTSIPPRFVFPPGGGFGPPGGVPPGGGSPPPPFGVPPPGPPSGPPGGPPGVPPVKPPGVVVQPVPSPPSVVLLVVGAAGLAAFRRRFLPRGE